MARIDFAFGATEKLSQACQTTLRQYLAGQKLFVYCTQPARMKAFDQQLWAVEDDAFVPHVAATDPLAASTPVVLVTSGSEQALANAPAAAWLLNLDDACPPTLGHVTRVLEIVSDDPDDKEAARARWRTYLAAGHDVRSHRLSAS